MNKFAVRPSSSNRFQVVDLTTIPQRRRAAPELDPEVEQAVMAIRSGHGIQMRHGGKKDRASKHFIDRIRLACSRLQIPITQIADGNGFVFVRAMTTEESRARAVQMTSRRERKLAREFGERLNPATVA